MKPVVRVGAIFRIDVNAASTPDAETCPPACDHYGRRENIATVFEQILTMCQSFVSKFEVPTPVQMIGVKPIAKAMARTRSLGCSVTN